MVRAEKRLRLTELEPTRKPDNRKKMQKNGGHAARHYYFEGLAAILMPATT